MHFILGRGVPSSFLLVVEALRFMSLQQSLVKKRGKTNCLSAWRLVGRLFLATTATGLFCSDRIVGGGRGD